MVFAAMVTCGPSTTSSTSKGVTSWRYTGLTFTFLGLSKEQIFLIVDGMEEVDLQIHHTLNHRCEAQELHLN